MKSVTNKSLQSLEVYFKSPKGSITYWLRPKQTLVVPENSLTSQVLNLSKRQLLKIKNA